MNESEWNLTVLMNVYDYEAGGVNLYQKNIDRLDKHLIKKVLGYTENNQTKTAKILGINRGTLRTKMKRHGLI